MKSILSRLSQRTLLVLFLVTELLLGATYIGVLLSQDVGIVLYQILLQGYRLLHTVSLISALMLALRAADGRRYYHGFTRLACLIAALVVKDYLVNFYTYAVVDEELAGDALLLALPATALNTLLINGVFLFALYSLGYLFFFYARRENTAPKDAWALDTSYTLAATCFITCMVVIPNLIATFISQLLFLIKEAMWMPTPSEVVTMALDLILIPAWGVIAYLAVYMTARYGKKKSPAEATE